jgi:hypothetical protein
VTGNDLDLADEQIRRSIPIFLNAGDVRASDRKREEFKHPDLLNWATRDNRRELVTAALTLIEHWRLGPVEHTEGGYVFVRDDDDAPRESRQTLGSFERWAAIIGGILEAAGVEGFLGNRDKLNTEALSAESQEGAEFLGGWEALRLGPIALAELVERYCGPGGELTPVLPTEVAEVKVEARSRKLTYWLRKRNGRKIGPAEGCFQPLYDKDARVWDVRRVAR